MSEQPEFPEKERQGPPDPGGSPEDSQYAARPPEGENQEGAPPAGLSLQAREFLWDSYTRISQVQEIIEEGEETLEFLELQVESTERLYYATKSRTVPLAEYLYLLCYQCRKLVRSNVEYFYRNKWTAADDDLFELAFKKLRTSWTAYKSILFQYNEATWKDGSERSNIYLGLGDPRENFIDALGQYFLQLGVVLSYIQ